MLSEHQLIWFSRSQESLGKQSEFLCLLRRLLCFISSILFVISGTESAKFLSIFLWLCSQWIIFVRLNCYLLHITNRVESIYQGMFRQKVIKFLTNNNKLHTEAAI